MQSASAILMIRPASFFYNEQTGKSNHFQNQVYSNRTDLTELAQSEFDTFVSVLRQRQIRVKVIEDTLLPTKPDAVFPNNWISFHEDGQVVTYPMESLNRRSERRLEVIQDISESFEVKELIDLAFFENESIYLEGTGSLVLDRVNKIAYACLSPRTNLRVLDAFANKMGYQTIVFNAVDLKGRAIYHTNVMMSVGESFALICLDAVRDKEDRKSLIDSFEKTGKTIITISLEQMNAFAGNILEVNNSKGNSFIILSETANRSFNQSLLDTLKQFAELIPISIPTIEKVGGGSVRCMMAEVFLPEN